MTTKRKSLIARGGLASVAVILLAACGSDATSTGAESEAPPLTVEGTLPDVDDAPPASPDTDAPKPADAGTISVRLEEVDGFFAEGFEIGLRFETPDGEVIDSVLWSDFVTTRDDPDIDTYYDSVLEQDVPPGEVVVLASVNVGIGPPPEVPDLGGELRCRLVVDVPADGNVEVVVTFSGDDDCLELG